jgi:endonuclease G
MTFDPKKLSKHFKRAAAVALLAVAAAGLTGCGDKDQKKDAPAATATANQGGVIVEDLCLYGCPTGAPSGDRIIKRPIYTLANNGDRKFADWVAYQVTAESIGGTEKRVWQTDPDLPAGETLTPRDYNGARAALQVDRGHQAPLASLTGTPYWAMANYLSNITPQATDLNEGPWEHLESGERSVAKSPTTVYSLTGPLYETQMPKLPHTNKDHEIPSGYWKIVAIVKDGHVQTAAFIMLQTAPRTEDFCNDEVTIRTVENRAHLKFFPKMNAAEREELETKPGKLSPVLKCGR